MDSIWLDDSMMMMNPLRSNIITHTHIHTHMLWSSSLSGCFCCCIFVNSTKMEQMNTVSFLEMIDHRCNNNDNNNNNNKNGRTRFFYLFFFTIISFWWCLNLILLLSLVNPFIYICDSEILPFGIIFGLWKV